MAKSDVLKKIWEEYTDVWGRITLRPAKDSDPTAGRYDSENNHLWTGEINLMLHIKGWLEEEVATVQARNFKKSVDITEHHPGLYARQPEPYIHTEHYSSVSLDEYNGIIYSAAAFPEIGQKYMTDMCVYGDANGWAFDEHRPNNNPWKIPFKAFPGIWKTLKELYAHAKATGDFDGSNTMDKIIYSNEYIEALSRIRLPKDRAFPRLAAGRWPGLISYIHFIITNIHTSKKESGHNSGKIMLYFKFKALEALGRGQNFIMRWCKRKCEKNLIATHGENYMEHIFSQYFPDQNHPLVDLIKGEKL